MDNMNNFYISLLDQTMHEIEELENDIKNANVNNEKIKRKRDLKLKILVLKWLMPYVVTAGVVIGGSTGIAKSLEANEEARDYAVTKIEKNITMKDVEDTLPLLRIIALAFGEIGVFLFKRNSVGFFDEVENIKNENELQDVDLLVRKLEIKEENYNRLMK